jgi:hypothetical protein
VLAVAFPQTQGPELEPRGSGLTLSGALHPALKAEGPLPNGSMKASFFLHFLNDRGIERDRLLQREMTSDALYRLSVDKDLDPFDFREIKGKRIHNRVEG